MSKKYSKEKLNLRSNKFKFMMLYIFVGFLLLSNIFFYSRYITIQRNANYMTNIANRINLAKTINRIDPIRTFISGQENGVNGKIN
jgi:hypothetical protein